MGPSTGIRDGSGFGPLDMSKMIVQRTLGTTPALEDEVTVEVMGQPGANKQKLYFLALAAANGMIRRVPFLAGLGPAYGMLMIEYDAAAEWVRCTIRYKWNLNSMNVKPEGVSVGTGSIFDSLAVYRGPQCNVVGDKFNFVDPLIPGIPSSSKADAGAPQLPFKGSMILTACPTTPKPAPDDVTQNPPPEPILKNAPSIASPNPKPPGDNRSRGAVVSPGPSGVVGTATPTASIKCCDKVLALIPLVYAALSAPATDAEMRFPIPQSGPTGT